MLRAYEAFLTKKGAVKTQYVPFYLKWVSDCYAFLNEPMSNRLGSEQKKQFLSQMAKRHEDWQVKQADTVLRLYNYFLSREALKLEKDGDKFRVYDFRIKVFDFLFLS
jgi:hypothetical protein